MIFLGVLILLLYIKVWLRPRIDTTGEDTIIWYTTITGKRNYIIIK